MGNDISHRRYWCRRFRRFERLPAGERTDVPDAPDVPRAQPGEFGGSESHPETEKPQSDAAGLRGKEQGRKGGMASCSSPVTPGMVRSSELLQELGDNPPATNPGGKTRAVTQGRAGGHAEVTRKDFSLQPAVEMGAGDVDTKQGTVKSSSGLHKRPSTRVCRASPLCRWLKKLKTPAEKPKGKPGAATS